MLTIQDIKNRIESSLPESQAFVSEFSGGHDHYSVVVVSSVFEGQTLLARHRKVLDLFQDDIAVGTVHALTIKTFTPHQWQSERVM